MGRRNFMEKQCMMSGLSMGRVVLMDKRWILMGLSMEEDCFVEKQEIAGRAGNDGEGEGGNDGNVKAAMTERAGRQ